MGRRTFPAGDKPEGAAAVKLANNMLIGCAIEAMGEAFSLVRKYGVDPQAFYEVFTDGIFSAPAYKVYGNIIAKELYDRYPDASEGRLAKIRSHVVSRQSCAAVARELNMGERLARAAGEGLAGEELGRIVKSRNVTAALLEAAIAALFLEHGYEPIAPAIVAAFSDRIEYARTTHVDHKTELQEALAKTGRSVSYIVVAVEGPAHERFFSCAAQIDGEELGAGAGRTKKEAEQEAAKQALAAIGA